MSNNKRKSRWAKRELSFRTSIAVKEVFVFSSGSAFPICPQCRTTMEREYQKFCDRCGQKLDWQRYDWASVVTSIYGKS